MHLLKTFTFYSFTSILNSAIPFLLLPVLTVYLTPSEFGILALVQVLIAFILPFTLLGIPASLYVEYFKKDKDELAGYLGSVLSIPFFSALLLVVLFVLFKSYFKHYLNIPEKWLIILPILTLFQVIPNIIFVLFQASEKPRSYAAYRLSITFVDFFFSILFVVFIKNGWRGRLLGIYSAFFIFSIYGLYRMYVSGYLRFGIKKTFIYDALMFGVPLLPHEISGAVLNVADRFILSSKEGVDSVGIYSIGYQVGMLVFIVSNSLNQAWLPQLFKNLKDANCVVKARLVKQTYLLFGCFLLVSLALYISAPLLFFLFIDKKYTKAIDYVLWVSLGYAFFGMYSMVANYIFYAKKTQLLSYITMGNSVINLVLNYILIEKYGAIGAAYATTISFFSFFISAWWLSNRVYPMPWFSFYKIQCEGVKE